MRLQCDFWAVLQAESTPKAAGRQRFPRSATPVLNNGCEKPPRTPGTMSKSGAVCCETVQKPPYEDETGAALRGGIGLAFIVMGTAFVETWELGGAGRAKWPVKGPSPDGGPRKRPSPGRKTPKPLSADGRVRRNHIHLHANPRSRINAQRLFIAQPAVARICVYLRVC